MTDIVPKLYKEMESSFRTRVSIDPRIRAFQSRLDRGFATQADVSDYAGRLGEILVRVIKATLTEDALPDGKLYWNIAERTILPLAELADGMVRDAMVKVIEAEYKKLSVGIKAIRGEFDEARFRQIINAMTSRSLNGGGGDE